MPRCILAACWDTVFEGNGRGRNGGQLSIHTTHQEATNAYLATLERVDPVCLLGLPGAHGQDRVVHPLGKCDACSEGMRLEICHHGSEGLIFLRIHDPGHNPPHCHQSAASLTPFIELFNPFPQNLTCCCF